MSLLTRLTTLVSVGLAITMGLLMSGPGAAAQQAVEESSATGPVADQTRLAIAVVLVGVAGLVLFGVRRLSRGRKG